MQVKPLSYYLIYSADLIFIYIEKFVSKAQFEELEEGKVIQTKLFCSYEFK